MTIFWTVLATVVVVLLIQNVVTGEKKIERRISHLYDAGDPRFLRSMGSLLGPPVLPGNVVQEFVNGDQIFPAMLAANRGARRSVCFETYIYWSGEIGREFADALAVSARSGVKIHEFQPTMYHCKAMIVDSLWVSVGSTNFDSRSFRLNDEANLNVHHPDFAKRQTEIFEADKARSRRITFEEWKNRPLQEKMLEHAAGLLRSQL